MRAEKLLFKAVCSTKICAHFENSYSSQKLRIKFLVLQVNEEAKRTWRKEWHNFVGYVWRVVFKHLQLRLHPARALILCERSRFVAELAAQLIGSITESAQS